MDMKYRFGWEPLLQALMPTLLLACLFISGTAFAETQTKWTDINFPEFEDGALIPAFELNSGSIDLSSMLFYVEDSQRSLDIIELRKLKQEDWRKSDASLVNLSYLKNPIWLKAALKPDARLSERWFFRVKYGFLDDLQAFLFIDGVLVNSVKTGSRRPFSERPFFHRDFVFPFTVEEGQRVDIYFRAENGNESYFPLVVESENVFLKQGQLENILHGVYIGFALVIFFYNLFLFVSLRDSSYLFYILFVAASGMYYLSMNSFSFQYLWPQNYDWNQLSGSFFCSVGFALANLFIIKFLNLGTYSRLLATYFYVLAAIGSCLWVLAYYSYFQLSTSLLSIYTIISGVSFIVSGVYAVRKGASYARYYVLGWFLFCATSTYASLGFLKLITFEWNMLYYVQLSSALEMVLISFALAARIKIIDKERVEALSQNKAKSELLAKVGHEIRNPMSGVLAMSEMLQLQLKDPKDRRLNDVIQLAGVEMMSILNDILDYSRIEAGRLEIEIAPFDLYAVLHNVEDLLKPKVLEKGLSLTVDIDSEVSAWVRGDGLRAKQIVMNLVSNAVKFTKEGGVSVEVSKYEESPEHILFKVIDTGIGIDKKNQKMLFKEFSQIDSGAAGTGLGLSISQQLVTLMGGWISIESELGKGSTFSFVLDLPALSDFELAEINFKELQARELGSTA